MCDSNVKKHLLLTLSVKKLGWDIQKIIKGELQASLYHREGNTQNRILGVVLPSMYEKYIPVHIIHKLAKPVIKGLILVKVLYLLSLNTIIIFYTINAVGLKTTDFVLVLWSDFVLEPEKYIDMAFDKRKTTYRF